MDEVGTKVGRVAAVRPDADGSAWLVVSLEAAGDGNAVFPAEDAVVAGDYAWLPYRLDAMLERSEP